MLSYIIFLLVAVSSDSDIYMMETGATLNKLDFKSLIIHCLIFGLIDAMMVLLGLNLSNFIINNTMIIIKELITVIVMFCISAILFVKTYNRQKFIEHRSNGFELSNSLRKAFLTGIDTFLIGMGISSFGYSYLMISILVFVLNISSSISSILFGYFMGAKFQKIIGYISALVYFILANVELIQLFI